MKEFCCIFFKMEPGDADTVFVITDVDRQMTVNADWLIILRNLVPFRKIWVKVTLAVEF